LEGDHPIQGLMKTAMESIKGMVDVNTVVGEAVDTPDGSVIIPVSRVTFGFAAGGAEYDPQSETRQGNGHNARDHEHAFGGGSGAGVSVQPVAFLVVGQGTVRLLSVEEGAVMDRIIDVAPQILSQIQAMLRGERVAPRRENSREYS
jgi:sporulation protein YtfJ